MAVIEIPGWSGRTLALAGSTIVLAGLLWSPSGRAQQFPSREQAEEMLRQQVVEMRERLELTPEQEQQIRPILQDSAKRTRELREQLRAQGPSRETIDAMREKMRKLRTETRQRLEQVLTEEQMQEYDKMQAEWRDQRRRMMRERRGRPEGAPGDS